MVKNNQSGQIVIILLLVLLVGLVIAISITQRSVNDLTVSTQTDEATKAYAAAEAGIQRDISYPNPPETLTLTNQDTGNDSQAQVKYFDDLPRPLQADEEPLPISRAQIAQFWLEKVRGGSAYTGINIELFFGSPPVNTSTDDLPNQPAIEVYVIAKDSSGNYVWSEPFLYDPNVVRAINNHFDNTTVNPASTITSATTGTLYCPSYNSATPYYEINTDNSPDTTTQDRKFRCMVDLNLNSHGLLPGTTPILIRIRPLYADNVPIALEPMNGGSLPYQKTIYTSIGKAGQSVVTLQESVKDAVYLPFFNFAIFSKSEIKK